jgi:phosphotransacetylase
MTRRRPLPRHHVFDRLSTYHASHRPLPVAVCHPCSEVALRAAPVTPKIGSTIDAAALCKMADRGQIVGAIVDGPLAFDTAVSSEAARIKRLVSPACGQADVLIVPDLESGNIFAKQLEYLGGAKGAGVVLGARVPIILTSRSDSAEMRLASAAWAVMFVNARG